MFVNSLDISTILRFSVTMGKFVASIQVLKECSIW